MQKPLQLLTGAAEVILIGLSICIVVAQIAGNLGGNSPFFQTFSKPNKHIFTTLGLYQNGWQMFSGRGTNTSSVDLVVGHSDGRVTRRTLLPLRPGYNRNVWNEVMQDIQFDDNNDVSETYKNGYLRTTCKSELAKDATVTNIELEQVIVPIKQLDRGFTVAPATNIIGHADCTNS